MSFSFICNAGSPIPAIVHHPAELPIPSVGHKPVGPPTTTPSAGQPLRSSPATTAAQTTTESPVITIVEDDIPEGGLEIPEMLARLKNLTPPGDNLITKLKDPPLFMFSSIPGKESDVQIFYDTGNSDCLFRKGVPKNLWGCLVKKGPHPIGAVGATTVWGGDRWACQPMTTQGSREILIGIEVDEITTDFPIVDITEAEAEIKASQPNNEKLQSLCVPKTVGGRIDILLGIQYVSHFPKLVHSLDSGLGIYEVRLSASSPCITAAIAGPHDSFNHIMERVGDMSTMLVAFTKGLAQWKVHGPPTPQHLPLNMEESSLAAPLNMSERTELEDVSDLDNPVTYPVSRIYSGHPPPRRELDILRTPMVPRRTLMYKSPDPDNLDGEEYEELSPDLHGAAEVYSIGELCIDSDCNTIYRTFHTQESAANLAEMKIYENSENNLESQIETLSLKEEAEGLPIEDTVKLDHNNERFLCSQPQGANWDTLELMQPYERISTFIPPELASLLWFKFTRLHTFQSTMPSSTPRPAMFDESNAELERWTPCKTSTDGSMREDWSWSSKSPWAHKNCSTLFLALIQAAAHIHHGWSVGELVMSNISIGDSLDKSVELLDLNIILACMVELFKAWRNPPRLLNPVNMISTVAPIMYQEKTMNSFTLRSMLVNVRRQPQSRKPHDISTSRHVNQFSWTLKGSSTLSTAHLHQDQLVAGGGESEYLLIKLESWSVGDLVVATTVLSVMTQILSHRSSELLSMSPQYSFNSSANRELPNAPEMTVEMIMLVSDTSSMAWKPPWFCCQICKDISQVLASYLAFYLAQYLDNTMVDLTCGCVNTANLVVNMFECGV